MRVFYPAGIMGTSGKIWRSFIWVWMARNASRNVNTAIDQREDKRADMARTKMSSSGGVTECEAAPPKWRNAPPGLFTSLFGTDLIDVRDIDGRVHGPGKLPDCSARQLRR